MVKHNKKCLILRGYKIIGRNNDLGQSIVVFSILLAPSTLWALYWDSYCVEHNDRHNFDKGFIQGLLKFNN